MARPSNVSRETSASGCDRVLPLQTPQPMMFHVKQQPLQDTPSEAEIGAALDGVGLKTTPAQREKLARHAASVLEANLTTNLTRITAREEFLRLHIVDSLLPLTLLDLRVGRVLDIGSGAGFPGIPLAVMGCDVTLCETRKKKAGYLSRWSDDLSLGLSVLSIRAEEIPTTVPRFDWVIVRAVSSLAALVEIASPLLTPEGKLVAMKAAPSAAELEDARRACSSVGMKEAESVDYSLPGEGEHRSLQVYRRFGRPRVSLPRRPGMAQSQPFI